MAQDRGTIERQTKVRPTPEELARCFAELGSDGQALFFNALSEEIKSWDKAPGFQWAWLFSSDQGLTREGLLIAQSLGEYALMFNAELFKKTHSVDEAQS